MSMNELDEPLVYLFGQVLSGLLASGAYVQENRRFLQGDAWRIAWEGYLECQKQLNHSQKRDTAVP